MVCIEDANAIEQQEYNCNPISVSSITSLCYANDRNTEAAHLSYVILSKISLEKIHFLQSSTCHFLAASDNLQGN